MPSNRDALIGAGTALNWPWQDGKFAALHGLDRLGTPWFPVRLEPSMGRNYLPADGESDSAPDPLGRRRCPPWHTCMTVAEVLIWAPRALCPP